MNLIMGYWGANTKRAYHHTAPVNAMYALHESLVILNNEGLENAWARHQLHHQALVAGLEAMGLSMIVNTQDRLPQLNLVAIPAGADDAKVRASLLQQYNLEIGAGLADFAGKAWRIGLMGHASNQQNVLLCLSALENVLTEQKADVVSGKAIPAALACY
jgi:alanine-glyoxylate transaminase/serine-glyoxylate transaminase/serine-pyruvate transaminase